ncbi:sulfite exporter TauE/SafE family protein [Candidatus Parcubacteria bacterium]|nr:sulfite exporter TauE/SafE family protein [Patescibacteria group bacterium]MCG2693306.1 sulfite exporter TauE/SafE family protein [Candidatus Parcubacteria bacterium]
MLKKIKTSISGIHCKSCKTLIETEVDVLEGVKSVQVDYKTGKTEIEFDERKVARNEIFSRIKKLGYEVAESTENTKAQKTQKHFSNRLVIAGVLLVVFVIGYYLVKRFGLLEVMARLNEQNISYWLILLIGLLASFHCVGMCGGLVMTYTTRHHAKNGQGSKPGKATRAHFQYNFGRVISYTSVGGILGGVGSFFGINPTFTGIITLIAGGFMLLMGLSLLTNFKWLEKIKLRAPDFIARFLYNQSHTKKPKGPFIIGLLNGFMPCGPLQAMQLYALASGSITRGALSMGIYALGTVPLMFGFGSFISLISQTRIKQVMKVSGAVVIILGLFMLNRGLINFGYGFKNFIPREASSRTEYLVTGEVEEYQTIKMDLTYQGYSPNVLFVKKDVPVRWIINVKQMSGCTDEIIMPEYNIKKKLEYGENVIEFVPAKLGDIKFSCWMEMVWGKFVVTEDEVNTAQEQLELEKVDLPQGSCSGGDSCGGSCAAAQTGGCGCSRIRSR